ncbi:MAG: gluconate 2-dehydrogenase subunit 3 family protein [Acidobacteriaceae bacterium]|nr:gluconate 2-dehydrogenase subunit 3 family protein [Acidobacteriaceae bacterium]
MNTEKITRRSLLDVAVRIAATPLGAEFFARWIRAAQDHMHAAGLQAPPEPDMFKNYQPVFFPAEDFAALQSITSILIPTDEYPGAREAHCAEFIDFVLAASTGHEGKTQEDWRSALAALREAGFHRANAEERERIVAEISRPEREPHTHHPAYFAYRLIKKENTFAFFTSREGMIGTLDYRGNSYNAAFPPCDHPEHHVL